MRKKDWINVQTGFSNDLMSAWHIRHWGDHSVLDKRGVLWGGSYRFVHTAHHLFVDSALHRRILTSGLKSKLFITHVQLVSQITTRKPLPEININRLLKAASKCCYQYGKRILYRAKQSVAFEAWAKQSASKQKLILCGRMRSELILLQSYGP